MIKVLGGGRTLNAEEMNISSHRERLPNSSLLRTGCARRCVLVRWAAETRLLPLASSPPRAYLSSGSGDERIEIPGSRSLSRGVD